MAHYPSTTADRSSEPFLLQLSRGQIAGHEFINKFGRNSSVASNGTEEVWDGSAVYSFPATALITSMSQTTDQSAMRGKQIEWQGLDANWNQVTQVAKLDATLTTNVVTLDTPMLRCFRGGVLANVVGDSPIRCHNAVENQDYAIIDTGNNQTLMAIYAIPANHTGYLTNYWAHHNPTTGQTFTSNPIRLWAADNARNYAKQLKHIVGIAADGGFIHPFEPYLMLTEKTDIYLTSSPVSGVADISAGFDIIIVEEL